VAVQKTGGGMLNECHYAMIARICRGQATADNARHYRRHATKCVFPSLPGLPRRGQDIACETPEIAVVEPEARAVLSDFDDCVRHYEVAHGPSCTATSR